jgi:hypothetical protein
MFQVTFEILSLALLLAPGVFKYCLASEVFGIAFGWYALRVTGYANHSGSVGEESTHRACDN